MSATGSNLRPLPCLEPEMKQVWVKVLRSARSKLVSCSCKKHGRAEEGEAMAVVVRGLESRYGFSSQ